MTDYGSSYTERREAILTRRLQRVYTEARKELQAKLDEFVRKKEKANLEKLSDLENGIITEKEYKDWLSLKVFQEKQWRTKLENATEVLLECNRKAMTLIREEQLNVFTENANWQAYDTEKASGFDPNVSFEIYDLGTVDNLVKETPELLPRKVVNGKKDKAWNQGIIANTITQGIIQGESIPKIAKRLAENTASTNMKAMIRYARTAMTGAQNAGRIETMHRAEGMGIRVRKQWLATLDSRTRDSHRRLDGQVRDVDKPFKGSYGNIMYPGDPSANPGDVYNCRCTLVYVYPDFPDEAGQRRDNETGEVIPDMTYAEWKERKERKGMKKDAEVNKNNASPALDEFTYDEEHGILYGAKILKGIGGMSKSYPILKNPSTGKSFEFVEGSRPVYPSDHTIAGKGAKTKKQIRDIDRLVETYNASAEEWQKEKARYKVYDEYGEEREIEAHWYQHPDIGRVEFKVKLKGGRVYVDEW